MLTNTNVLDSVVSNSSFLLRNICKTMRFYYIREFLNTTGKMVLVQKQRGVGFTR